MQSVEVIQSGKAGVKGEDREQSEVMLEAG